MILGDHVTLEAGTGAVHTAPGHGQEDFVVGKQYELAGRTTRVGGDGALTCPSTPLVSRACTSGRPTTCIIEVLRERGALLHARASSRHSYPHCWRHKTPVIFRATPQWFIAWSSAGLRRDALRGDRARCAGCPSWGEARISGMIEGRPDWCISRQRTWGVPIALFVASRDRRAASAHAAS